MWTPKGRTKSVHNSEVSTLVKLTTVFCLIMHNLIGLYRENKRAGQKVSTAVGCPQRHSAIGFYMLAILSLHSLHEKLIHLLGSVFPEDVHNFL